MSSPLSITGLTENEAKIRLQKEGFNEVVEERRSVLSEFLKYFWGPIPWMIEAALILSLFAHDFHDAIIIGCLLFINSVIGFQEEHQAGNVLEALKKRMAITVKVKRDHQWKTLPARELVKGDLIHLKIGDIVPADAMIQMSHNVTVDQSALTGESLPQEKRENQILYSGSILKTGELDAEVTQTGSRTYFGKTAELVSTTITASHLQKALLKIGRYLIYLSLLLATFIVIDALFHHFDLLQTLRFVLILIVASIPAAMPTIFSITLALGARALSKQEAIVSHLTAIQELASIDILCCDKTGTLTQNTIRVASIYPMAGIQQSDVLFTARIALKDEEPDPIDQALIEALPHPQKVFSLLQFTPFDPVRKRAEARVRCDGKEFLVSKGSVPAIASLAGLDPTQKDEIQQKVEEFAQHGFRTIACASNENNQWNFLGLIALHDPPRTDSKKMIQETKNLGIEVKMVTGDQLAIAKEVGHELEIGDNYLLKEDFFTKSESEKKTIIDKINGFSQVFPEDKYEIVKTLKEKGHNVGVTGDGVNDAPALKLADCGIAVSGSSDAARSAADIILLKPGLHVIVEAIKESRRIFQRMKYYATYRIAETIRILLFITASILAFQFYPLTAIMIILLAVLNDIAIISIAYDRVEENKAPEKWHVPSILKLATLLGLAGVISSFIFFFFLNQFLHLPHHLLQTFMYLKLSIAGHFTIFVTRTKRPFYAFAPSPILLWAVIGTQIIASCIALSGLFMPPISFLSVISIWLYCTFWLFVNDGVKRFYYYLTERKQIHENPT